MADGPAVGRPRGRFGLPVGYGQAWEMSRYRAYQAHLAGHTVGETLGRATAFLKLAGANASSITETSAISLPHVSAHAAR